MLLHLKIKHSEVIYLKHTCQTLIQIPEKKGFTFESNLVEVIRSRGECPQKPRTFLVSYFPHTTLE